MTSEAWRKAGRPNWVVRGKEAIRGRYAGDVYYHTHLPLCSDINHVLGTTGFMVEVEAGSLIDGGPTMQPLVFNPCEEPQPIIDPLTGRTMYSPGPVLLWDRNMRADNAQRFTHETEDPDCVPTE